MRKKVKKIIDVLFSNGVMLFLTWFLIQHNYTHILFWISLFVFSKTACWDAKFLLAPVMLKTQSFKTFRHLFRHLAQSN